MNNLDQISMQGWRHGKTRIVNTINEFIPTASILLFQSRFTSLRTSRILFIRSVKSLPEYIYNETTK